MNGAKALALLGT
ncbi:Hypothetical protein SSCIU_01977 [Mammaliicoccus sciuri]|nr:Hypothetical protein SSCIU_01977 [Mammaliicoccus sciuri]